MTMLDEWSLQKLEGSKQDSSERGREEGSQLHLSSFPCSFLNFWAVLLNQKVLLPFQQARTCREKGAIIWRLGNLTSETEESFLLLACHLERSLLATGIMSKREVK